MNMLNHHKSWFMAIAGLAVAGMLTWALPANRALAAESKMPEPIRIGVIAPAAHIDGRAIFQAAKLAADKINTEGGIDGRPIKLYTYDDQFQAANAVRAFQRAVQQDHVVAVTGVFISEVALALEPWAARLHTPLIITGAASTEIDHNVHNHYKNYRYIFHEFTNSKFIADAACDFAHDILVKDLHYKTADIFSEDAAWTIPVDKEYEKRLPKAGLKVLDKISFAANTEDFAPIYSKIEKQKPDVLMTAIAHEGVKPIVQWRQGSVPVLMAGANGQGGSSAFYKATNGACDGVIVGTTGANGAAVTPKTPAFFKAYVQRFNEDPAYDSYTEYDAIFTLKDGIEHAGSTEANKLVASLEKTDRIGVTGPISFYGPKDEFTHDVVYVPGKTVGVYFQWQKGKQVVIWPKQVAQGKIEIPSFVMASKG